MKQKTRLATVLFAAGLLTAGVANASARYFTKLFMQSGDSPTVLPFFSTFMFCLNLAVYFALLLFWIQSARRRLLPSKERTYLVSAAVCALAMLMLRSAKYRMIDGSNPEQMRWAWYLYYVPMLLLPTLFLMTCIRIEGNNGKRRFDERWMLIPAGVLTLLFLTNDLHHFAFTPYDSVVMNGGNGTYKNNFLIYVYYSWFGACVAAGLVLLTIANRRLLSLKKAIIPFLFPALILGLTLLDKLLNSYNLPSMFLMPESVSFGMVGIFEFCIRNRLIPYNENYAGFFAKTPLPVMVTEDDLTPVYRTARAVEAEPGELLSSVESPVYTDENTKLSGERLRAGYAFYSEDETELNRLREKIIDANELIESENDLIQAENELRQRKAIVDSRNTVYERVSERMYPYHRRAQKLLDEARPNTPQFKKTIERLNIINAYIKRATNIMLVEEGSDDVPIKELRLALEETARYLRYCGAQASVSVDLDGRIERETALRLFTAFEEITWGILDDITMLGISLSSDELRLVADCERAPGVINAGLPAEIRMSEELCFFIIKVKEGVA